jgi:hypothetical protein
MQENAIQNDSATSGEPAFLKNAAAQPPRPWEMIETGRYQPKRIKGSCVGRELG